MRDRVAAALAPLRIAIVEVGPRRRTRPGTAVRPSSSEVVEELEHRRGPPSAGPRRPSPGAVVGHSSRNRRQAANDSERSAGHRRVRGAHQRREAAAEPVALGRVRGRAPRACVASFARRLRRVLGVQDAGLRLHDLPEGPERRCPRRRAGTVRGGTDQLRQLVDVARPNRTINRRLPDARLAHHRDELRRRRGLAVVLQQVAGAADSSSRPTNGGASARVALDAGGLRSRIGSQIAQRFGLALDRDGGQLLVVEHRRVARWSSRPRRSRPVGATPCRREAVFTTSPVTLSPICGPSPNATSASPVLTADPDGAAPGRAARRSAPRCRRRIRKRGAHRALGVVLVGHRGAEHPQDGVADELVHRAAEVFDLVASASAWYGRRIALTSSGSAWSDRSVNPTRSQNRTVTTFRSSPVDTLASGDPQFRQKRAPSGFFVPHRGQTITAPSLSTG